MGRCGGMKQGVDRDNATVLRQTSQCRRPASTCLKLASLRVWTLASCSQGARGLKLKLKPQSSLGSMFLNTGKFVGVQNVIQSSVVQAIRPLRSSLSVHPYRSICSDSCRLGQTLAYTIISNDGLMVKSCIERRNMMLGIDDKV